MKKFRKLGIEASLDPSQEKKKKRLQAVMDLLRSEKEIELNEFCGFMCSIYGIRRQTLMEYLKDLMDLGVIEIVDGKIKWLGEEREKEG